MEVTDLTVTTSYVARTRLPQPFLRVRHAFVSDTLGHGRIRSDTRSTRVRAWTRVNTNGHARDSRVERRRRRSSAENQRREKEWVDLEPTGEGRRARRRARQCGTGDAAVRDGDTTVSSSPRHGDGVGSVRHRGFWVRTVRRAQTGDRRRQRHGGKLDWRWTKAGRRLLQVKKSEDEEERRR